MSFLDAVILGLVQGLTEFLPVSSSGHLILGESLLGLDVAGLAVFDIAVHFGTLLAILVYFRKDFWKLIVAFLSFFGGAVRAWGGISKDEILVNRKLVVYLVLATLPAIAVGLLAADWLEEQFRSPYSVAIMMLIVAAFFITSELIGKRIHAGKIKNVGLLKAIGIGVAQSVALVPGVSRSGSTISTGILFGLERREAARFSFLLGSIAILAATLLSIYKAFKGDLDLPTLDILAVGIVSAGFSGYAAIAFMLRFLRNHSLYVFAGYLGVLAVVTLWISS